MERAIAEMEKIRRAEEIYSKRKNAEDEEQKKSKSIYKTLFEILFLINVIVIIIAVQNQKYIFTEDFIKQVNSYNINVRKKIDELFSSDNKNNSVIKKDENVAEENNGVSGESNDVSSALVENEIIEKKAEEPLSQEAHDILKIKENYSIILPLEGVKTSGFGERESTNPKVTKYHTGVDIGAEIGTKIVSATTGIVVQVSNQGDYGKHVKVQTGDELSVLYAHCSKIYVEEGQEIKQGDEIGEVGATGNATGPHLHFEIRLNDKFVNPESIIDI